MRRDPSFPSLVSLACHDLRTHLVTIGGFARTVPRVETLGEQAQRFLDHIVAAAQEISDLVDDVSRAAHIEGGRFAADPEPVAVAALVRSAGELAGEAVRVDGDTGAVVEVDAAATARALAALARAAQRHGGAETVTLRAEGAAVRLTPVVGNAGAVLSGAELADVGAAVALRVLEAVGASTALDGDALVVSLPSAGGGRAAGP